MLIPGISQAMAAYEDGRIVTDAQYTYDKEDGWDNNHTDISDVNYLIAICPTYTDNPTDSDIIDSLKLHKTYSNPDTRYTDSEFDASVNNCFGICMNNSELVLKLPGQTFLEAVSDDNSNNILVLPLLGYEVFSGRNDNKERNLFDPAFIAVSYTHLTLPTNREV